MLHWICGCYVVVRQFREAFEADVLGARRRRRYWQELGSRSRTALAAAGNKPGVGGSDTDIPDLVSGSDSSSESEDSDAGIFRGARAVARNTTVAPSRATSTPAPPAPPGEVRFVTKSGRSHEAEVLLQQTMYDRADRVTLRVKELMQSSKEKRMALIALTSMAIPGGSAVDPKRPLACDKDLSRGAELIVEAWAFGTWKAYHRVWLRVKEYLQDMVRRSGYAWHVSTFKDEPRFISAAAVHVLYENDAMSTVEKSIAALKMAMRVNNVHVAPDLLTQVVCKVNRRRRAKSVRKRPGLLFSEVQAINLAWGDLGQSMVRRMVALMMCIGFLILLRFSDLAMIHLHGIYWCKAGVMICLARRKNNQEGIPSYLPVADTGAVDSDGTPCSAVARLRAFVTDLVGEKPPAEGWMTSAASDGFLFRRVKATTTSTHASRRVDEIVGSGERPMGRESYSALLARYREAMHRCCRMSKRAARTFGTQSARSGGDTWLFDNNLPADIRMEIGEWATPSVERGYLRVKIAQQLEMVKAVGL